jgi:hypothetical protein
MRARLLEVMMMLNSSFRLTAFAFLTGSVLACGDTPSAPSPATAVRLLAQISPSTIARGESATISFRLENVSSNDVELTFPSSCQILPYISLRDTVTYPSGGWGCATVITKLALPAGGSVTRDVPVRAADAAAYPVVALAPGEYVAYATIDAYSYPMTSPMIPFTVR